MGFLDAQVAELVRVIDGILAATGEPGGDLNGAAGPVPLPATDSGQEFGGKAGAGWSAADSVVQQARARLSAADADTSAALADLREHASTTRRRLTGIRAELLELRRRAGAPDDGRTGRHELVTRTDSYGREIHAIVTAAQQFSRNIASRLADAANKY